MKNISMKESDLLKAFLELWQIRNPKGSLYRNNTGAWKDRTTGRLIRYGLCKGSSDLIGYTVKSLCELIPEVLVKSVQNCCTEYPKGCKNCTDSVAVFTAYEIKSPKDKASPDQKQFIETIKEAGGIAEIIREEDLN